MGHRQPIVAFAYKLVRCRMTKQNVDSIVQARIQVEARTLFLLLFESRERLDYRYDQSFVAKRA